MLGDLHDIFPLRLSITTRDRLADVKREWRTRTKHPTTTDVLIDVSLDWFTGKITGHPHISL